MRSLNVIDDKDFHKAVRELNCVVGELHLTQFVLAHLLNQLHPTVAADIGSALRVRAREWMHELGGDSPDALVDERVSNVANTYLRMLERT